MYYVSVAPHKSSVLNIALNCKRKPGEVLKTPTMISFTKKTLQKLCENKGMNRDKLSRVVSGFVCVKDYHYHYMQWAKINEHTVKLLNEEKTQKVRFLAHTQTTHPHPHVW